MDENEVMQKRVVRAFWDASASLWSEGADKLGVFLLVVGDLPDGEHILAHRGLYEDTERIVQALRLAADEIEAGHIESAPELDREQ